MIDLNCRRPVVEYCLQTGPAESNPSLQAILTKSKLSQSSFTCPNSEFIIKFPCTNVLSNHCPCTIQLSPPKSSIVRAAQDPDGVWALRHLGGHVSGIDFLLPRFHVISVLHENLHFLRHGPKFDRAITFAITFSRRRYLHHPKLHAHSWSWTNG